MTENKAMGDDAKIIKRDGRVVPFDREKITFALFRALRATGNPDRHYAAELSAQVVASLETKRAKEAPSVEEIQDVVEKVLFENRAFDAAKTYIIYRFQHGNMREAKEIFANIDLVDDYLHLKDWRVKENANLSYSLQGLNLHI